MDAANFNEELNKEEEKEAEKDSGAVYGAADEEDESEEDDDSIIGGDLDSDSAEEGEDEIEEELDDDELESLAKQEQADRKEQRDIENQGISMADPKLSKKKSSTCLQTLICQTSKC